MRGARCVKDHSQIETYSPAGHLLEIGCEPGDFLKLTPTPGFSLIPVRHRWLATSPLATVSLSGSFDVLVRTSVGSQGGGQENQKSVEAEGYVYLKAPNSRSLLRESAHFPVGFTGLRRLVLLILGKSHGADRDFDIPIR
jgi:hypothetical protein